MARTLGSGGYADVGAWHGGSTVTIAHGLKDGGHRGTVYSVDFFGNDTEGYSDPGAPDVLQEYFDKNFEKHGIHLNLCVGDSSTWGTMIDEPLKFVFIDADHRYEGCQKDFFAWGRLVVPGGVVAFHDVQFKSVSAVVEEAGPEWIHGRQIFSTRLLVRTVAQKS